MATIEIRDLEFLRYIKGQRKGQNKEHDFPKDVEFETNET